MSRQTDENRILLLLEEGGMSNQSLKTALSLTDARYKDVKQQMLAKNLLEVYRARGGGVRLTAKGMEQVRSSLVRSKDVISTFSESDLYEPFIFYLNSEVTENDENAEIINIAHFRQRGKWTNPDVVKISVDFYPLQRVQKLFITSYEVKKWLSWNVESVFEAASHRKIAHQSYLVLEWVKDEPYEISEHLQQTCVRLGVGLMVMKPYYSGFRHEIKIPAETHNPIESHIEEFLETWLFKDTDANLKFNKLWKADRISFSLN